MLLQGVLVPKRLAADEAGEPRLPVHLVIMMMMVILMMVMMTMMVMILMMLMMMMMVILGLVKYFYTNQNHASCF